MKPLFVKIKSHQGVWPSFKLLGYADVSMCCRDPTLKLSVLPLCCYGKVLDFVIKKTPDYKYVTDLSDYKKIGVVKTRCNANNDIAQLIVNQTKKMGDSNNLTDDHSGFVAVSCVCKDLKLVRGL